MYRTTVILLVMLFSHTIAHAAAKSATFFADGAIIEITGQASKGIAETQLPADMSEDTLRITPMPGTTIQTVEILPPRVAAGKAAREIEELQEQKRRLEDRLRALATREEIFKSAAKSQSGKAPRKTKSNPDPLQSIRQGTDFAIAQLEAVYTSRRKTEQEMRRLEARIAALRKNVPGAENVARVSVSPKNGRIRVRYALAGQGWTPRYDLRLSKGGNASLTLYGQLPVSFSGYLLQAAPGTLAGSTKAKPQAVSAGSLAKLMVYSLPMAEETFEDGPKVSFACILDNNSADDLPAGDLSLFRAGEYLGQLRFEGISSGRSRRITTAR